MSQGAPQDFEIEELEASGLHFLETLNYLNLLEQLEMFYLITIEQLFLLVEQLDQLEVYLQGVR